jgi:hypothetical protein
LRELAGGFTDESEGWIRRVGADFEKLAAIALTSAVAALLRPPAEEYATRLAARDAVVIAEERRHLLAGNLRLAVAGLGAVVAWVSLVRHAAGPAWLAVPVLAFAGLAIWHDRVLQALGRARRAARFYRQGLARLDDTWPGTGSPGDRFLAPDHPYAADLDLFGRGSIFELLSRARVRAGEETLAAWLTAPASPTEIRARQASVEELRDRLDLREDLALLGEDVGAGVHPDLLTGWGQAPPLVTAAWPAIAAAVLAALALASLAGWAMGVSGPVPFAAVLGVELIFSIATRQRVRAVLAGVEPPAHDLALLSAVLARFERETFSSAKLGALRARLGASGQLASRRIAQLQRLIDLLNSRQNQLFAPLAAVTLWGAQVAFAIERWRRVSGPHLSAWLEGVGELEALCSLAGYAYERPHDPFPEVVDAGACFEADALAHPLIPASRSVANDVALGASHQMLLVSGSNMSGKSTLLRTVGTNAVLALAGAPVRAVRLRLSPLAVGATLRVQDSLAAGQSRFFAEITRVRAVVALTAGPLPVLFLLDELLSGTNSHDRQHGAEAIVGGLLDRGAIGLVTTHDLALSAIAERLAPRAENVHFADEFDEGTLRFDYRMRPGVVRTSNAIALMRAVGFDV